MFSGNFIKLTQYLGIDKAILFTSSSSFISIVGSVFSAILVLNKLTVEEQGYYYTFSSLIAVQIFFELGFNNIITQFTAYESASIKIDNFGNVNGDLKKVSRLAYLFKFSLKLYFYLSILLCITLILIGMFFFLKNGTDNLSVTWKGPWGLLALSVAINFFISPFFAFLQGIGLVTTVARIRFAQQVFVMTASWVLFIANFKLYTLGVANVIGVFFLIFSILKNRLNKVAISFYKVSVIDKIDYLNEIFPYQWKIAVSWISGYFIFQLFNPILFATSGPVAAGQMGMTLAALNGIQSISASWMSTKIPTYSILISQKKYFQLDQIFNRALCQSLLVSVLLVFIFLFFILAIDNLNITISGKKISERFISFGPLILMSLSLILNQVVGAWGTYLRSHKKEPFLITSVFGAFCITLSSIFLGNMFGLYGLCFGYFFITLIFFPITYFIYKSCKYRWHVS